VSATDVLETVLYKAVLHYTILYCIVSCNLLHSSVMYWAILYHNISYYIILYHTISYCSVFSVLYYTDVSQVVEGPVWCGSHVRRAVLVSWG